MSRFKALRGFKGKSGVLVPSEPSALIWPGASWDGTATSGGAVPWSDPARTTAKPSLQWGMASGQRVAADTTISVFSYALGGVTVDLFCNGRTASMVQVSPVEWQATLDIDATLALHTSGNVVRLYARATAVDGSMQARVIGPLTLYPEATAYDFNPSLGPSGDYATVKAVLSAFQAGGYKAMQCTVLGNGPFELTDGDWTPYLATGFARFRGDTGIDAVFRRAATPSGDSATWAWKPKVDSIEIGAGVTLDNRNWSAIETPDGGNGARLNGGRLSSSANTKDIDEWPNSDGLRPIGAGLLYVEGNSVVEFQNTATAGLALVRDVQIFQPIGDLFSGSSIVSNAYVDQADNTWWRTTGGVDIHGDVFQAYGDFQATPGRENYIIYGLRIDAINDGANGGYRGVAFDNENGNRDIHVVGSVGIGDVGGFGRESKTVAHCVFDSCSSVYLPFGEDYDAYCKVIRCADIIRSWDGVFTDGALFEDSHVHHMGGNPPPTGTGVIVGSDLTGGGTLVYGTYVDDTPGDFRPKPGGKLLTPAGNLRTRSGNDPRGVAFTNPGPVGAWAAGGTVPAPALIGW